MIDAVLEVIPQALALVGIALAIWTLGLLISVLESGAQRTASEDVVAAPAQVPPRLARSAEHRVDFIDYLHGRRPRVHCTCRAVSQELASLAQCHEWIALHADIEASIDAMAGGQ